MKSCKITTFFNSIKHQLQYLHNKKHKKDDSKTLNHTKKMTGKQFSSLNLLNFLRTIMELIPLRVAKIVHVDVKSKCE